MKLKNEMKKKGYLQIQRNNTALFVFSSNPVFNTLKQNTKQKKKKYHKREGNKKNVFINYIFFCVKGKFNQIKKNSKALFLIIFKKKKSHRIHFFLLYYY